MLTRHGRPLSGRRRRLTELSLADARQLLKTSAATIQYVQLVRMRYLQVDTSWMVTPERELTRLVAELQQAGLEVIETNDANVIFASDDASFDTARRQANAIVGRWLVTEFVFVTPRSIPDAG